MKKLIVLFLISNFCVAQTKIGSDIYGEAAGDYSGWKVALSGDGTIVAIGSILNNGNGSQSGSVRVFQNVAGVWTKIGNDIDGQAANDSCGSSVSLSSDGTILAIGSYLNDTNGSDSGSVRVFQNILGVWTQIGNSINGTVTEERFGISVSLSNNGSIIAIGGNGNGSTSGAGVTRVYQNIAGVWTQIGATIIGESADSRSGRSVSLSSDGNIVAIGANFNSNANGTQAGSVRVYQNIAGVWTKIGNDIDGEAAYDASGQSVSISGNGSIVAIGARLNDGNGTDSGSARVYQNIAGNWIKIGNDIDGEASNNFSGESISLSKDGSVVAIGAPLNSDNGMNSGSVRVYQNIAGNWTKIGVDIDGEVSGDFFGGYGVSLSDNSTTLAIGGYGSDGNGVNSGVTRVYNLSAILANTFFTKDNFSIYPNPCQENIKIDLDTNLRLEKVNIYNALGQLLVTENSNNISISSLMQGTYFVEVITDKGKATKSIIKN